MGPVSTVRPAGEIDFDALTDVWERAARSSHAFMADDDFAFLRPRVRDLLLPSMDVWTAVDDAGTPIGFVGARDGHVELLYVDPDAHGRGIGTALLAQVGDHGPTSVEVYAGNTQGLGFYRARGFTETRAHARDAFGRPFPVLHLRRP